jgi:hypothetical protein
VSAVINTDARALVGARRGGPRNPDHLSAESAHSENLARNDKSASRREPRFRGSAPPFFSLLDLAAAADELERSPNEPRQARAATRSRRTRHAPVHMRVEYARRRSRSPPPPARGAPSSVRPRWLHAERAVGTTHARGQALTARPQDSRARASGLGRRCSWPAAAHDRTALAARRTRSRGPRSRRQGGAKCVLSPAQARPSRRTAGGAAGARAFSQPDRAGRNAPSFEVLEEISGKLSIASPTFVRFPQTGQIKSQTEACNNRYLRP